MNAGLTKIQELVENQWVDALKTVLASMTPEAFDVTIAERTNPSVPLQGEGDWSWYSQKLSTSSSSTIYVGAANEGWTTLSKALLKTLGLEEASATELQSICTDIVSQANGALAQELTKRFGSPITCGEVVMSERPEASAHMALSVAGAALATLVNIGVSFDESIFKDLSMENPDKPAEAQPSPKVPGSISDLRLNLHGTLGRTELLLDNILKLNIGSVIDIGRSVNDLVEVVANGKVIASGQVVAFRGNYAIKIVSTKSKAVINPAVFQSSSETGGVGSAIPVEDLHA